jgi:hypothetical protein
MYPYEKNFTKKTVCLGTKRLRHTTLIRVIKQSFFGKEVTHSFQKRWNFSETSLGYLSFIFSVMRVRIA